MKNKRFWELLPKQLNNEFTIEEFEEFTSIINSNPDLQNSYFQLKNLWNEEPILDSAFLEATYLLHLEKMEKQGAFIKTNQSDLINSKSNIFKNIKPKILFSVAASFLIIVVSIVFFSINKKQETFTSLNFDKKENLLIQTNKANKKFIELIDGTKVFINSCSKITYDKESFNIKNREINLEGEAYFEVVKNLQKPFIIHTSTIDIRVLGTKFNVKSYSTDITTEASLTQGKIEVMIKKRPGEIFVLKPNEKIIVQNDFTLNSLLDKNRVENNAMSSLISIKNLNKLTDDTIISETAWTKDWLVFENEDLYSATKKMERWFGVEFEFVNKEKQNILIRGTFKNETIDQALIALEFSFDFKFKKQKNKIFIY